MQEIKKRNIKVFCENPNSSTPLRCLGFSTLTNESFYLDADKKKIVRKQPQDGIDRVYVVEFKRKTNLPDQMGHQYYTEFTIYDLQPGDRLHEDNDTNTSLVAHNEFLKVLEIFLKQHNSVIWTNKDGKSLNPNTRRPWLRLVDEEANAEKEMEDRLKESEAMNYLNTAFAQEDETEWKNVVFGFGLGSWFVGSTKNMLYNMIAKKIELNPDNFLVFIKNPEREMEVVIAMATEGFGGVKEMEREGDTYTIGNLTIGTGIAAVKSYFKGNQEQYEYLKSKYVNSDKKKDLKTSKKGVGTAQ